MNTSAAEPEKLWNSDADHNLKGDEDMELVVKVLRAKQREEMMAAIKEEEKQERQRTVKLSVKICL